MGFFDDKKRNVIREQQNTGFLTDYLIRSEVTDYYRLRLLMNTILGFIICSLLYEFAWKNLNFGDFDYTYGLIVKCFIILLSTYAFAVSPVFRCALLCVLIGAFGKQGQYPFTILVVSNLQEGPISHMFTNYEITSDLIMCHIELQSKVVANRVALIRGPLEELIEKMMAKGTRALKAVAKETRALITPFMDLLRDEESTSDKIENIQKKQLEDIEKRKEDIIKMWEKSLGRKLTSDDEIAKQMIPSDEVLQNNTMDEKPGWMNFKTSLIQKFTAKFTSKCEEMFTKGIDKCSNMAGELEKTCENALVWPVEMFICPKLNVAGMCENVNRRVQSINICKKQLDESGFDPSLEQDIADVMNMTEQLEDNAKIELHSIRVETPRVALEYRLSDMKIKIRSFRIYFKNIVGVSKQILQAFFIYFVYTIFRDAVAMIKNYQTNIAFRNTFVTREFWAIDNFRKENGQTHLTRFSKEEKRNLDIMEVFSFPTKTERSKAIRPFFKWFTLLIMVVVIVVLDYYFYTFLDSVIQSAKTEVKQKDRAADGIQIEGEGVIADLLRTLQSSNETLEIDQTLSNEHCLTKPAPPNTKLLIFWLLIPLILSFIFQVIFSFAIQRIILNYFLPFMFPRRSRARLIFFYNKCLVKREVSRKEARTRVRFMTERRKIQTMKKGELSSGSFIKLQIFERIFKTAKCFICQQRTHTHKLMYCDNLECQSAYCTDCIEDNYGKCYSCMVIRKEVDDQKSKLLAPTEVKQKDKFLKYSEFLKKIEQLESIKIT